MSRHRAPEHCPNAGEQLLVVERPHEEVVATAVERAHAVDRIRLRLAQDDHRHVAVPCAELVQCVRVPEQDEVRLRLLVDDLEAVVSQMTFEERPRVELRLGE